MLRKLLLSLTAVALCACVILTGMQLEPVLSSITVPDAGDRFERAEKRYTVTANVLTENDGESEEAGGKVTGTAEDYAKGETVNLVAVPYEGYLFNGWYTNKGAFRSADPDYSFNIEKNTVINAKFVPAPEEMEGVYSADLNYTDTTEHHVNDVDLGELEEYLESSEGRDFLEEQLNDLFSSDSEFTAGLFSVNEALFEAASECGYVVELVSEDSFKNRANSTVSARVESIDQDRKCITVDIFISHKMPIKDASGKTLATFELKFLVKESITLTPIVSDLITADSYNIGIGIGVKESAELAFDFIYNGESMLTELERNFDKKLGDKTVGTGTYDKINDSFAASSSSSEFDKQIKLFARPMSVTVKGQELSFDISFISKLDIKAAMEYKSECEQYFEIGVRSSENGPISYEKKTASAKCSDLTVSGMADVYFGIGAAFDFVLTSGDTVSFNAELGSYTDISGFANLDRGYSSARLDLGTRHKVDCAYSLFGNTRAFGGSASSDKSVLTYGYDGALLGFAGAKRIESGESLALIEKETDISEIPFLDLSLLNIDTLGVERTPLSALSEHYTVKIKTGANLVFDENSGKLKVKDGAPLYFEENITVSVKAKSSKWAKHDEGKMHVSIPEVTVRVVFGNIDAYYDSTDTNIQKQFRKIYRGYNQANADVLKGGFEELIESFIKIPEDKTALYHDFTATYLDELFDLIGEYRRTEDDKRTNENSFVYSEADIFEDTVMLIGDLVNGKNLDEEAEKDRIYKLLEASESTTALYNTLIRVQNIEELKTQIAKNIGEKTRVTIYEEIAKYEAVHSSERAKALIEAARNLFPAPKA